MHSAYYDTNIIVLQFWQYFFCSPALLNMLLFHSTLAVIHSVWLLSALHTTLRKWLTSSSGHPLRSSVHTTSQLGLTDVYYFVNQSRFMLKAQTGKKCRWEGWCSSNLWWLRPLHLSKFHKCSSSFKLLYCFTSSEKMIWLNLGFESSRRVIHHICNMLLWFTLQHCSKCTNTLRCIAALPRQCSLRRYVCMHSRDRGPPSHVVFQLKDEWFGDKRSGVTVNIILVSDECLMEEIFIDNI